MRRLILFIKSLHSLVFLSISVCVLVVLYSAAADRIGTATWIALAIVLAEGLVLAINGWRCPLTTYAEKLGAPKGRVTDIFLPRWFADRTFTICGAVFAIACLLLLVRLVW